MSKLVHAVARTPDVLPCFSQAQPELTLPEIAKRVPPLHTSTMLRALCTLESRHLAQGDASTGKYERGLRLLEM